MQDLHEQLILKSLTGTISSEEQQELKVWLDESPEHRQKFEEYREVWDINIASKEFPDFQSPKEWESLEARIEKDITLQENVNKAPFSKSRFLAIAASVSFLLIFTFVLYWINFKENKNFIVQESGDQQLYIELPDGSEVWLNRESRLSYPKHFEEWERRVQLSGEAFFEVQRDAQKPFFVELDKAAVKVLGTSFNVKTFKKKEITEVYVQTGKVSLFIRNEEDKEVIVNPGEKGFFGNATLGVERENNFNTLAWRQKKLVFIKTPLKEVVKTLNEYYNINVSIDNPQLLNCRFTSSFQDPDLEEVLEVLKHALNLNIFRNGKSVEIKGNGC